MSEVLSLYDVLKSSKMGLAPDMWTALAGMNLIGKGSGHEVKELTGIPPLSIRSNGTMLLDYLISGNLTQTGTPTPQNPIQPQECGERTANLWNLTFTSGYNLNQTTGLPEVYTPNTRMAILSPVDVKQYNTVTFNFVNETTNTLYMMYSKFSNGSLVRRFANLQVPATIDVSDADSMYICVYNVSSGEVISGEVISNVMLNLGSTVLPYEPYGYKLPITSTGQTNNIYLGEVPTTRKIKKLVLTGKETYTLQSINSNGIANFFMRGVIITSNRTLITTHFKIQSTTISETTDDGYFYEPSNNTLFFRINSTTASTVDEFKSWLAEQNANGTPVTVWYVLATPETGIVNEPLRKIGNYADTVSYEQTGVQIPTNNGDTVIDVETTLKPSEMYIKYRK